MTIEDKPRWRKKGDWHAPPPESKKPWEAFYMKSAPFYHPQMRYEELVGKPESVVKRIYNFLDLDFSPAAFQFRKNLDSLGDADREIHKNLKNPINDNSIGKWRKKLDDEEQQVVQNQLRDKLLELNYSVD
ncbi:sulfotransferase domain-containing protein [candidate division KSB1 bacterium]|nr:sulfotransferase domain-containing protein [candidate division KSB1 bacterium]